MNSIDLSSSGFLDSLLLLFETKSLEGIGFLLPHALWLLVILGVLQLTTTWTLYEGDTRVRELLNLVFKVGVAAFLVYNFGKLAMMVFQSFQHAGFVAAGPTAEGLSSPSSIIDKGINVCARIFYYITNNIPLDASGDQYFDAAGNYKVDMDKPESRDLMEIAAELPKMLLTLLCGLVMMLAFFWIAFQIMLTQIEFYLFLVIGMFLIPFMVFRHTAFLSQKVWGGVVQYSIKIMALAFIVGLIGNVLNDIMVVKDADIKTLIMGVLGVGTMALLAAMVPQVIAGMVSGGAGGGMQASQVKQAVAGAVGAAIGASGATVAMARMAQANKAAKKAAQKSGEKKDGAGGKGGAESSGGESGGASGEAAGGKEATQTGSAQTEATRAQMQAEARGGAESSGGESGGETAGADSPSSNSLTALQAAGAALVAGGGLKSAVAAAGNTMKANAQNKVSAAGNAAKAAFTGPQKGTRREMAARAAIASAKLAGKGIKKAGSAAAAPVQFTGAFAKIAAQRAIANSTFGRSAIKTAKDMQDYQNFAAVMKGRVPSKPIVPDTE